MRELFLTSVVPRDDLEPIRATLGGFTMQTGTLSTFRVLFYDCGPEPKPLKNDRFFKQSPHLQLWKDLSDQLARTSYILQVRYLVDINKDFGQGSAMDLNSRAGILRWNDVPDPAKAVPVNSKTKEAETPEQLVTIRRKIDIPGTNLLAALADNGFRFVGEVILDNHVFAKDLAGLVISEVRVLPESPAYPVPTLPAFNTLRYADPRPLTMFNVRMNVNDSQPENVKKGVEELLKVKVELEQLCDFRVVERKLLDTRVVTNNLRAPPGVSEHK
ncbi:mediator complex, subunit Med18 [Hypoxylon sp. FL1150]|nr:mediator complex, subunit Med18 [Hypoxylon sp. FL1150]